MFEHYSLPQFQSTITIIGHAIIKHTLTFLYEIQYDLLQDLPKILRKQTATANKTDHIVYLFGHSSMSTKITKQRENK